MKFIGQINGFDFVVPESGGKAGKGCNVTSSIQVRKGNFIVKQFRFKLNNPGSYGAAIVKARAFAEKPAGESA